MTTAARITVRVPLAIRRRPGRKTVVMPEGAARVVFRSQASRTRLPLWDELFPAEQARIVRLLVERVEIGLGGADIRLRVAGLASLARDLGAGAPDATRVAA